MSNSSIIKTLLQALENTPDDIAMRLHLADLLLKDGETESAGRHFELVLRSEPANPTALKGAAEVASQLGDDAKTAAYQTLLSALESTSGTSTLSSTAKADSDTPVPSNISPFPKSGDTPSQESSKPGHTVPLKAVEPDENVSVGPWEDFEAPICLADVGGMEDVKKRLNMSFLAPLKNPEIRKMYGKSLKGGMLLYGPPGCGKTFIARALAGELGATFMSIGLADVLDMWLGESEKKLHEIFETARRKAPAVLFFDEVDALGQKRSQLKNSGGRTIVNQLLAEMDSIGNENKNVYMLAATNHPWDVDTALRRPGRFDRIVLVLPPDLEARKQILEFHLRDRPVADLNLNQIASQTDNYSGADLAHLCESAVEFAMHDSIETGQVRSVVMDDFIKAHKEIKPSTRAWFETARNYAMFSNEGGVYDDLLDYLQTHKL